MNTLTMNFAYLSLLVLSCWSWDRCDSLLVPLSEGDIAVTPGHHNCDGPINIPYEIFNYKTLYVCTHGLVSFGLPLTHTRGSIPRRTGPPFIAVNWRYFNTHPSIGGRIFYRSTSSDASLLASTSQVVQHAGFYNFQSRWVLVVTWHNVTSFSSDSSSTFQLVLTSDALRHVMIFHYGRIYHVGTGGYDGRDGYNYFRIRSGEFKSGTNVGVPGRWVFRANEVPVRLVALKNPREGRVEVFYNATWGTVCDHYITDIAAKVICSQLNFGYLGYVLRTVHTPGTGPIWLDKVQCTGAETELAQCPHLPWGYNDCSHQEDLSIACYLSTNNAAQTPSESHGRNVLKWLPRLRRL